MSINQIELAALKKDSWSEQELHNAKFVLTFVQKIMNDHDFEYVKENYGSHPYKQHNRTMTDGPNGVLSSITELCKVYPEFSYDVRHMYVDGDYVTIQSHVTLQASDRGNPNKGLNIYDTWKVVDDQIVEHWDAVQGIDEGMRKVAVQNGGVVKNENTLF
ncbi:MAG: ester cyclase [Bacteroidota bacterium]